MRSFQISLHFVRGYWFVIKVISIDNIDYNHVISVNHESPLLNNFHYVCDYSSFGLIISFYFD